MVFSFVLLPLSVFVPFVSLQLFDLVPAPFGLENLMDMNLKTVDLDSITIAGYTLTTASPLEKYSDHAIVAFGQR